MFGEIMFDAGGIGDSRLADNRVSPGDSAPWVVARAMVQTRRHDAGAQRSWRLLTVGFKMADDEMRRGSVVLKGCER